MLQLSKHEAVSGARGLSGQRQNTVLTVLEAEEQSLVWLVNQSISYISQIKLFYRNCLFVIT